MTNNIVVIHVHHSDNPTTTHQQNVRLQALLNVNPAEFGSACANPQQDAARQDHLGGRPAKAGADKLAVPLARNARQHERNAEKIGDFNATAQEFANRIEVAGGGGHRIRVREKRGQQKHFGELREHVQTASLNAFPEGTVLGASGRTRERGFKTNTLISLPMAAIRRACEMTLRTSMAEPADRQGILTGRRTCRSGSRARRPAPRSYQSDRASWFFVNNSGSKLCRKNHGIAGSPLIK